MTAIRRERSNHSSSFDDNSLRSCSFSEAEEEKKWVVPDESANAADSKNTSSNEDFIIEDIILKSSVSKYKEEMRKRRMTTGSRSQLCKLTVNKVQGILLPQKISSYIPVSTDDSDDKEIFRHPSRIPLIKGLERVTSGAQPASEVVATCGIKPHRFIWFIISTLLCDVVQFLIDLTFYYVFQVDDTTLCWLISFTLAMVARHSSHRYLVFGNYVGGYRNSLLRMCTAYGVMLVISTLLNLVLTRMLELKHYSAWTITLIWTNIMNYFLLSHIWSWDWSNKKSNGSFVSVSPKKNNRLREVV